VGIEPTRRSVLETNPLTQSHLYKNVRGIEPGLC